MKEQETYVAPRIEVIEMDYEGVIAQSNTGGYKPPSGGGGIFRMDVSDTSNTFK